MPASEDETITMGKLQLAKKEAPSPVVVRGAIGPTHKKGGRSSGIGLLTLKKKVSKKKRRFEEDGYDLDLTYITDRIIAMGFPSQGVEAIYRNDMKDVQTFLEDRHKDRYRVYNLCTERTYDMSKFHNRTMRFPFDDHAVPPFATMNTFLQDVHQWLTSDDKNVAVIHCKAGKGRTGVTIATYLLYCGMWKHAAQALSYYGFVRTQNSKGVTIPSQRRWVYYYEELMAIHAAGKELPPPDPIKINKIVVSEGGPRFDHLSIECLTMTDHSSDSWKHVWKTAGQVGGVVVDLEQADVVVAKDVRIVFSIKKLLNKAQKFSCWINTQFIKHGYVRLEKEELDKINKKRKSPDFFIEVFFENYDELGAEEDLRLEAVENEQRRSIVYEMKEKFGFESESSSDSGDDNGPSLPSSIPSSPSPMQQSTISDQMDD